MHKKLLIITLSTAMSLAAATAAFAGTWQKGISRPNDWWYDNGDGTYASGGWHWIDGNNDGTAECYYFDTDGWMLSDGTTPDGYTVDANGAWVQNGAVQTKNVGAQAAEINGGEVQAASGFTRPDYLAKMEAQGAPIVVSEDERYIYLGGSPYMENGGQLTGTYTLTKETENALKSEKIDEHYNGKYNPTTAVYMRNGEKMAMGIPSPAGVSFAGKWVIDKTKPDSVYGKTNIRFIYNVDGTYAGYGWHGCNPTTEDYRVWRMKTYPAYPQQHKECTKENYFFTEDGYLVRNAYVKSYDLIDPNMVGQDGGWIDRASY